MSFVDDPDVGSALSLVSCDVVLVLFGELSKLSDVLSSSPFGKVINVNGFISFSNNPLGASQGSLRLQVKTFQYNNFPH